MPLTAAEIYAGLVRATETRPSAEPSPSQSERWSPGASRFREDPFREKNETLDGVLSFIEPDDVVLDVGGGAGRYLPLALKCRRLVNVEPSAGMGAQFEAAVKDAKIANAEWLHSDWLGAQIEGEVCFTANVVYYIADIVPFVEKLTTAARRRVMVIMHSIPPTNIGANLHRLVYGREPALAPSHRELLPVLWDMGLLPDVRVLGPSDFIVERARFAGREEAIQSALPAQLETSQLEFARENVERHFDEIFMESDGRYRRRPAPSRVLLITWETKTPAK